MIAKKINAAKAAAYLACKRNRHHLIRHGLLSTALLVFFADAALSAFPLVSVWAHMFLKPFAVPIAALAGHLGFLMKPDIEDKPHAKPAV